MDDGLEGGRVERSLAVRTSKYMMFCWICEWFFICSGKGIGRGWYYLKD